MAITGIGGNCHVGNRNAIATMGLTLLHSRNVLATETLWQTMISQVLTTHGDQNMEASLDMTIEELASQILLSRHL